jgi:amino acid transporter
MSTAPQRTQEAYGYRTEMKRTLSSFTSFAVGFSFISVTSGVFASYGFALTNSGPRGIWLWLVVGLGQTLIALIFMQFAARIPIAGYSYQWASRLLSPRAGWGFGWLAYAFLAVVVVAVDYGFASQAFMPLFNISPTLAHTQIVTICALIAQATLICASARGTALVNGGAVGAEVIGMIGLTVVLLVAALIHGNGSVSHLTSSGIVPDGGGSGYWKYNGPFMLAILVGAYTIVGFEAAANLAEETEEPTKVVPKAMLRAVTISTVVGFLFLLALTIATPDIKSVSHSAAPVSAIMRAQLGTTIKDVFLVVVNVAIFANGLIIMLSGSRLVFAMSRDKRFPGHQLFRKVSGTTATPIPAVLLILAGGVVFTLVFSANALVNLFTAASILPALIYLVTVLLYVGVRKRLQSTPGAFSLGRWEPIVIGLSLLWIVFELTVLVLPGQFWGAVKLVGIMLAIGVVVFAAFSIFSPKVFDEEPSASLVAPEDLELPQSQTVPQEL